VTIVPLYGAFLWSSRLEARPPSPRSMDGNNPPSGSGGRVG